MRFHREGAWPHVCTDFIPHQRAVGEAQRGIGPDIESEMMVNMRRVIAAHAQDAAALRLPSLSTPEYRGIRQRPSGQCDTSREASLEQVTTAHTLDMLLRFHREPSLVMLPLQPQRRDATAVVEGEVGGIVLHI